MLSAEILLRYLAIIFLFLVMLGCMCVVGWEIMNNQTPSAYAIAVLGSGLGYAITAAGVSHGSSIVQSVTGTTTEQATSVVRAVNSTTVDGGHS